MRWFFFACLHALKWGNHFWLSSWSVSLNASLLQLYLLDPKWLPEGPMKWGQSILCFCLSDCFLGIGLFFSEFWHGAKNSYENVRDIFWKNSFCPKDWKNGPKVGFFELKEKFTYQFLSKFVNNEISIICCVPAQIPYLGKIFFLIYQPKCSQPVRLQDF